MKIQSEPFSAHAHLCWAAFFDRGEKYSFGLLKTALLGCKLQSQNPFKTTMKTPPLYLIFLGLSLWLAGCGKKTAPGGIDLTEPRLMTGLGHGEDVLALALSADGDHAITGSSDYTARYWHVPSRREIWRFVGHKGAVMSVALSPDGKTAATGGEDRQICLWETETGEQERCWTAHEAGVLYLSFSKDGQHVGSSSEDGTAKIWSANGDLQQTLKGHKDFVESISFAPNGTRVATASLDGTAGIWDVASGQRKKTIGAHTSEVWDAAYSLDGKKLATASADRTIKIWNVSGDSLSLQADAKVNWNGWEDVSFSKDGQFLAGANTDKTVRLFRTLDGLEVKKFEGHTGRIWAVAIDPQMRYVISAGADQTVRIWSPDTGQQVGELGVPASVVTGVAFSPDQQSALLFRKNHELVRWKGQFGPQIMPLGSGDTGIAHFSGNSRYVLVSGGTNEAVLWSTQNGQKIQTFKNINRFKLAAGSVSGDGKWVAFGEPDGTVTLHDAATGVVMRHMGVKSSPVGHTDFSADGRLLLASRSERDAVVLDVASGRILHKLTGHGASILSVALSPDGKTAATASRDAKIRLWDTASGTMQSELQADHPASILRFSPDGSRLASVDVYGGTILWSSSGSRDREVTMPGLTTIAFSPDGAFLLAGTLDGLARVFDTGSGNIAFDLALLPQGQWVASDAESHFIASNPEKIPSLYWNVEGQLKSFTDLKTQYYKPELLQAFLK